MENSFEHNIDRQAVNDTKRNLGHPITANRTVNSTFLYEGMFCQQQWLISRDKLQRRQMEELDRANRKRKKQLRTRRELQRSDPSPHLDAGIIIAPPKVSQVRADEQKQDEDEIRRLHGAINGKIMKQRSRRRQYTRKSDGRFETVAKRVYRRDRYGKFGPA